ncbi:translocation/assembly module TamB domain-containing protein [Sporohalobacter salinus]|uniref:translocation/assembly module TamB domain-containing protein n=1 Tax=Sporohalobacter salinus TaxID=1494606 RepID=UPI0019620C82|nr:translocation/assembly module TamB domain-containing protein [Sporohalobacter salinus]MBM7622914.1 translocation and assembly module TamB [Sporohalobacter salinus]
MMPVARKFKRIIPLLVIVLLGSFFFMLILIKWNGILKRIKNRVITEVETKYGHKVSLDRIEIKGFNELKVYDFSLKTKEGHLLLSDQIQLSYNLWGVIFNNSDSIESITEVKLINPRFNWKQSFQNQVEETNNFQELFNSVPILNRFSGQVTIKNGKIFTNRIDGINRIRINKGNLDLTKNDLKVKLDLNLPELGTEDLIINGSTNKNQFKLSARLDNLNLSALSEEWDELITREKFQFIAGKLKGNIDIEGKLNFDTLSDLNYKAELNLTEGIANSDYLSSDIQIIDSNFEINSKGIVINKLVTDVGNSRSKIYLSGLIHGWQKPTFHLGYRSSQLDLNSIKEWLPSEIELKGRARIDGRLRGSLDNPTIKTNVKLPVGSINGYQVNKLNFNLWYKNNLLTFNDFKTELAKGTLTGRGTINWPKDEGALYTASLEAKAIDLKQLPIAPQSPNLTGKLNSNLVISGQNSLDDLSFFGNAKITDGSLKKYEFDTLNSNFWFSNQQLLISNLDLKSKGSEWQARGLIDAERNLNLNITADNVKLSQLNNLHNYQNLAGTATLQGQLKGKLSDPHFLGEVQIKDVGYSGKRVDEVVGVVGYRHKVVDLNDVIISEQNRKYRLTGEIKLDQKPKLDLNLKTKTGELTSLYKLISVKPSFEVDGQFSGDLGIIGPIDDLKMIGEINLLNGQIREMELTSGSLSFIWQNDILRLKNIKLFGLESQLIGSGRIEEDGKLALDLEVENIDLAKLDFSNYDISGSSDIKGRLDFSGEIKGSTSQPVLAGKVNLSKLFVDGYEFQTVEGNVKYIENKLNLDNLKAVQGATEYSIKGSLNLQERRFLNLSLDLVDGRLNEVIKLLPLKEVKHDIPHSFFGTVEISGRFEAPKVKGRLIAKDIDQNGYLLVDGSYNFNSGANLNLETRNFALAPFNQLIPESETIGGDLNLTAKLEGKLEKLNMESNIEIRDGQFGTLEYDNLKGGLDLTKGKLVELSEPLKLKVNDDNLFEINGYLPLRNNKAALHLNINLNEGNLNLLSHSFKGIKEARGELNAELTVSGSRINPNFAGDIKIDSGKLDVVGLKEGISNLEGKMEIKDQEIDLKYLTGQQDKGGVEAQGSVEINEWHLGKADFSLSGKRIAIEHGSWKGSNDLNIEVKGDINNPLISGNILAYDTRISLPFEWPKRKSNSKLPIKPNFDIKLEPGDNVKVQNDNIDILVEKGGLQLVTIGDDIKLQGRVSSKTGNFNYYNTDFELESGSAIFNKYEKNIPYLNLTATTKVTGIQQLPKDSNQVGETENQTVSQKTIDDQLDTKEVTIILNLSGLADQMEVEFESDPPLSRQKIINLLVQQGGLRGLLTKDYDKMIQAELFRMLESKVDIEILSNIEETLEDKWDLDRFKIYTGLSNGLQIKMGKNLTDDLMLKYNQEFNDDGEHTLGFEYEFMNSMKDIVLDGSINNDEEYKLELEVNFPFN